MADKKFMFTDPNTGIAREYRDTSYFRKMTARIQKKYDNLSAEQKARIKKRIEQREARSAETAKKVEEVRAGRAAGLTMTEIRAKRMNISADELKQRQLGTLLGMAEGTSLFLPAGAAIRGGMLVYKGLKGAAAARALRAAANAKKAGKKPPAKTVKTAPKPTKTGAASKRMPEAKSKKPAGSVPAGGSRTKPTSKDKPTTVRQDKPKVRVPATTRGGASSKRMPPRRPGLAKNRKRVDGKPIETPSTPKGSGRPMSTRQMLDKVRANAAKRTKPPKPLTPAQRAAIAGRSAAPAVKGAVSDTNKATTPKVTRSGAASKRMPVVPKKTTPKISASAAAEKRNIKTYGKPLIPSRSSALVSLTGKPAETGAAFKKKKNGAKPTTKSTPKTTKSGAASKRMPTAKKRTAPSTASEAGRKGTPKRVTRITAGANVGFGPKGNIYPRDAADRRRLMAKYGGTGSAAARAAAQGKQGNMKKGSK